MAEKPIFPDCAFPDACQCAERGYQHERDTCAVATVVAAVDRLGLPARNLFRRRGMFQPDRPPVLASTSGSVQPLPNTGNLGEDVRAALAGLVTDCPLDAAGFGRMVEASQVSQGLRAEAGLRASTAIILAFRESVLKSGTKVVAYLTVMSLGYVDAAFWNVTIDGNNDNFLCATLDELDLLLSLFGVAGGGVRSNKAGWLATAPTEAELEELRRQ